MFHSHILPSHRVRRRDVRMMYLAAAQHFPSPLSHSFPSFSSSLTVLLYPHLSSFAFSQIPRALTHSLIQTHHIPTDFFSFPNGYQLMDVQTNASKRECFCQFGSVRRSNGNCGEKDDWSNGTSSKEWCQPWGSSLFNYQSFISKLSHSEGQIRCCLTRKGKRSHSSMGWE